jgi:hypothetical protein
MLVSCGHIPLIILTPQLFSHLKHRIENSETSKLKTT